MNWGIIGLGNIAHLFVQDLQLVSSERLQAVASRKLEKAFTFAKQYDAATAYGNYNDLIQDPKVDIVYIATPHNSHSDLAIQAMQAGKHVLCEKPLAVNESQVSEMIEVAKTAGVFFMEAFWTRFNPSMEAILHRIKNGEIGVVNYINADFTFFRQDPDNSRMLDPKLAGGSLLEMGVYPVFLAYVILGTPSFIQAFAQTHTTGVDLQTAATFKYPNAIAQVMSGFKSQSDMSARICGTQGSIYIDPIWHETQGYQMLDNRSGETWSFSHPTKGKGFTYEIEECIHCIRTGQQESEKWSWADSLALIKITDKIRAQTGVIYPFENPNIHV